MPHPYDTPQDVRDAIGDTVLARLDARDIRLRHGGGPHISVVDFQIGDTGQHLAVCRNNLWTNRSFVTGGYLDDGALYPSNDCASVYFTELHEIPAAVEQVAARKDEWRDDSLL